MSHIGARVSALVDGRLPAAEEERCWEHVLSCPPCRDLVEREGWVKTSLAGLSYAQSSAPSTLKDSLRGTPGSCVGAVSPFHPAARAWSRGMVAVGGSALGAAVLGAVALGPGLTTATPRPPQANVGGAVGATGQAKPHGSTQRREEEPSYLAALGLSPVFSNLEVAEVVEMVIGAGGYSGSEHRVPRRGAATTPRETMHQ